MFYTSQEEIALNVFCRDQVKPLLNELLDHFDGFQNLFQRDIKEMKDAFEQNDVYLDEIERQNDLLKDQLLEVSLKHDIELCVLLSHECVDESLHDELKQVKKKSLEIQEGLKARIKILEKAVQRCEKQKEQKLRRERALDFKIQRSLLKELDEPKWNNKKLFESIKNARFEVAFRLKHVMNSNPGWEEMNWLTGGTRRRIVYPISLSDMAASFNTICLMSKATSTKSCPMKVASVNGKKVYRVTAG
ncbi:hypothetical protein Tco_1083016 [Tanacetum coccineum]|uniref:Uncharacterized protein n=1 Tax=Tanacetum coccineum TaxID=301880 RepID=A0ABQ5I217_9ASTR